MNTNPAAATLSTTSREKRCCSFPIVPLDTVQGQTYTVIQSTSVLNGPFAYNGDTLSPEDVKAIQELFTSSLDNKSKVLVNLWTACAVLPKQKNPCSISE